MPLSSCKILPQVTRTSWFAFHPCCRYLVLQQHAHAKTASWVVFLGLDYQPECSVTCDCKTFWDCYHESRKKRRLTWPDMKRSQTVTLSAIQIEFVQWSSSYLKSNITLHVKVQVFFQGRFVCVCLFPGKNPTTIINKNLPSLLITVLVIIFGPVCCLSPQICWVKLLFHITSTDYTIITFRAPSANIKTLAHDKLSALSPRRKVNYRRQWQHLWARHPTWEAQLKLTPPTGCV